MKKKRLLKTLFATVLTWMACATGAWADTSVIQNGVGGWTKLSSLPSTLSDYYFVLVDKDNDLMMSYGEGINQTSSDSYLTMVYRTSEDPARNPLMLWTLGSNDGGYSIKSAVEPTYYLQTENNAAWYCRAHDNGGGSASWYKWNITLSDGAYRIENGKYTGNYIGPWVGGAFSNGQEVAGNKTASGEVGYFYIYSILRSAVDLTGVTTATTSTPFNYTYRIKNPNAVKNTNGWTMGAGTGRNDGDGTFDGVKGFFEPSQWGWNDFDIEMSQSVSGLPAGKYRLRAAIQSSSDCTVTLKANDNSSEAFQGSGTNNGTILQTGKETTEGNGVEGWKWRSLDFTDVTGTINIVFNSKTSATHNWANVDNVELYLLTPCLSALATSLPSGSNVSSDKWYVATIPSDGDYNICTTNAATINYTQDGTQLAESISSSSITLAANGKQNISLTAGNLYLKSSAVSTISIEATVYNFADGQDITSLITNPGFEDDAKEVTPTASTLGAIGGWTVGAVSDDTGTRAYSNSTYSALNGVGDYCFNTWQKGVPLTQSLGSLPAGTYELSALVTTGDASTIGTVYLNANSNISTGYARKSANANYYVRERLVFTLTESGEVTIGIRGGSNPATGANKGTWVENGYWWYKCDDFKLTYLCKPTQANLASKLATLVKNCAPWTTSGEYYTNYQTYKNYSSSNSVGELTAAINYLTNEYEKYALENGSVAHPYDLGLIQNPSYSDGQNSWADNRSATGSGSIGITSDGTQTNYFNSSYNTHTHHSTIYQEGIILDEGLYKLSAKMKGTPKDDVSTYIYATTGSVDYWGGTLFAGDTYYGYLTQTAASSWSTVDAYLTLEAPARIQIGVLSWGNNWNGGNGGAFSVDDWKLEKIDYAVTTKSGVTTAIGPAPIATINSALTGDVAALNLQKATGLTSATISTTNNPNLLIFANSGQVSNSNNVVVDGTCSTLVLVDGYPFVNPTSFTATSASYTMSAVATGKDRDNNNVTFGTLMVPFNATKPGGSVYALDQDVDLIDGNVRGTSASIEANKPVLVTAAGNYTGSNVTVPVVSKDATFTNGQLVGTYTPMTAVEGSYVLQNHTSGEGVAFYLVGSTKPTVNPFRAYIQPQASNVKAISVMFDEDGISAAQMKNEELIMNNAEIFNVAGQRLSKPVKGVNIINGKKVIVK